MTLLIIAAMFVVCLAGCAHTEETAPPVDLPNTTSAEANIYANGEVLCNSVGTILADYRFDEFGNVLDRDGNPVIAAENLEQYTYVTAVTAKEEIDLVASIKAEKLENDLLATRPVTIEFSLAGSPEKFVDGRIRLESRDPGALYFPYESNKDILAAEITPPADDAMPEISVDLNTLQEESVHVIGVFDGEYVVIVKNALDETVGELHFILTPEYVDDINADLEGEFEPHDHDFRDVVVDPTPKMQGYTLHICKICGFTFRDTYVDKLPCTHEYEDTVVPPTYTAGGYTLHVCSICGDTYKDSETAPLVCKHEKLKKTVVEPTCTEKGYTIYECEICKNYTEKKDETPAAGHKWDKGKVTTEPTCGEAGVKTFTCKVCKVTKTESVAATGKHNYEDTVLNPTCDESGYTLHKCKVCGDSYKDTYTDALGHTDPVWSVTKEATCAETGTKEGVCERCGEVIATETIEKTTDHDYETTVVEPDCENAGYTKHTCKVCGDVYKDQKKTALGHDWEEKTKKMYKGKEKHVFCGDCGKDLTAAGITGDGIADHAEAHVLKGGSGRTYTEYVKVYETVTKKVCTRCGKEKS